MRSQKTPFNIRNLRNIKGYCSGCGSLTKLDDLITMGDEEYCGYCIDHYKKESDYDENNPDIN